MAIVPNRRRAELLAGLGLWLVFLFAVGLPRALERHFHVDEVQLSYETSLAMVHHRPELAHQISPVLVTAGWLISALPTTSAMFAVLRLVFFALFAVSLAACAWAQTSFTSTRGRLAVLFAATLCHPLWLYGFEIRMDLFVSLGSIIFFGLMQRATSASWRAFFVAGVCSATMQMHSLKAIAYWIPFSVALLAAGTWHTLPGLRARVRPSVAYVGGLIAGVTANVAVVAIGGQSSLYLRGWTTVSGMARSVERFSPTPELVRSVMESPVLFGLAGAQIALAIVALARRQRPAPTSLVTTGFLLWSLAVLYVNPVPFPYNFRHVMPFALFAALDVIARLLAWNTRMGARTVIGIAAVSLALFVRAWMTSPYAIRTNAAQLSYARAAEALTRQDETVLDGAGLVLSRLPPHKDWFLHSLRMAAYRDGALTPFADIMIEHPSPVILDNYRWSWLTRADLETRDRRYVRIAPRLLVLGSLFESAEGEFPINVEGRYQIVAAAGLTVQIDGVECANGQVLVLARGPHHYVRTGAGVAGIRWIGADERASTAAIEAIRSLGRREPMFTNTPMEVPWQD